MRLLFSFVMVLVLGYGEFALVCLASDSENWLPSSGVVVQNTDRCRTIMYAVGKQRHQTDCEDVINILQHQINMEITSGRHSRTVINGVDPAIGLGETVYYNPKNPSIAVVEKGWTQSVVLLALGVCVAFFGCLFSMFNYAEYATAEHSCWYGE